MKMGLMFEFIILLLSGSMILSMGSDMPKEDLMNIKNGRYLRDGSSKRRNLQATHVGGKDINDHDDTEKYCVIHAGPHKTGSTTLQLFGYQHNDALTKDNYKLPAFPGKNNGSLHHTEFAFCIGTNNNKCSQNNHDMMIDYLHSFVDDAASQGSNILMSTEEFDRPDIDIAEMTSFFVPQGYKIHVVVYYRRFYDWIHSWYNQIEKSPFNGWNPNNDQFVDWLTNDVLEQFQSSYSVAVYTRYKEAPGIFDVSLVNMHEDPDNFNTNERFFCNHVNQAFHSCEVAMSQSVEHSNPSENVDWKLFRDSIKLYHPIELSSSDERWERIEVKFYEMTDIPKRCLSAEMQKNLLEISLQAEKALTPESWYNGDEGLEHLKSDFGEKISSKLCSTDIEKILTSPEWQGFLTDLEDNDIEQGL